MAKFHKTILRVGEYESPDGSVVVTPQRLAHWEKQHQALSANRQVVPIDWDHASDPTDAVPLSLTDYQKKRSAKNTVGRVADVKRSSDGNSMELTMEISDPKAVASAKSNHVFVSPVIFGDWKDGKGNVYEDVITHVDIVNHPVDSTQTPFKALSILRMGIDAGKPQSYRLAMELHDEDEDEDDDDLPELPETDELDELDIDELDIDDDDDLSELPEADELDDPLTDELDPDMGDDIDETLVDLDEPLGGDIEDELVDELDEEISDDAGDELDADILGDEAGLDDLELPISDAPESVGAVDDILGDDILDDDILDDEVVTLGYDMVNMDMFDDYGDMMGDSPASMMGEGGGDDAGLSMQVMQDLEAAGIAAPQGVDPADNPLEFLRQLSAALRQKKLDEGVGDMAGDYPDDYEGDEMTVSQPEFAAMSLQVKQANQRATAAEKALLSRSIRDLHQELNQVFTDGQCTGDEYKAQVKKLKATRFSLTDSGRMSESTVSQFVANRKGLPKGAALSTGERLHGPNGELANGAQVMSVSSQGGYDPLAQPSAEEVEKTVKAQMERHPEFFRS